MMLIVSRRTSFSKAVSDVEAFESTFVPNKPVMSGALRTSTGTLKIDSLVRSRPAGAVKSVDVAVILNDVSTPAAKLSRHKSSTRS